MQVTVTLDNETIESLQKSIVEKLQQEVDGVCIAEKVDDILKTMVDNNITPSNISDQLNDIVEKKLEDDCDIEDMAKTIVEQEVQKVDVEDVAKDYIKDHIDEHINGKVDIDDEVRDIIKDKINGEYHITDAEIETALNRILIDKINQSFGPIDGRDALTKIIDERIEEHQKKLAEGNIVLNPITPEKLHESFAHLSDSEREVSMNISIKKKDVEFYKNLFDQLRIPNHIPIVVG